MIPASCATLGRVAVLLLAGIAGAALTPAARAQDDEALRDSGESVLEEGAELPAVPSTPETLAPESSVDANRATEVASAGGARLRALDRLSGATEDVALNAGESRDMFRLQVTLSDCRFPVNDPSSNAYAHLTIRDRGAVVFDGWMVAASPALSALDNPRYDVWPLECLR